MINAVEFNDISTNIFYPIYPVIAKQIKDRTGGKEEGYCMDIGSGNGYLGISIAKITNMEVNLYDISEDILKIADERIKENGLEDRVHTEVGDVLEINKPDESVDLIISRGSMFFWEDRAKAFKEIFRVLKVGGYAYIGGGFGTLELKAEIDRKMLKRDPKWLDNCKKRKGTPEDYIKDIEKAGINDYSIIDDEKGLWIVIEKKQTKKDIYLAVFPSCPIKVGMTDMIRRFVEKYNKQHTPKIQFNMMEDMDVRDYKEFLASVDNADNYPDIILECGYGVLFEPNFKTFAKEADYEDVLAGLPKSDFFQQFSHQDPNKVYSVLGGSMSVIVVDRTLIGDLPVPRSLKELQNPIYKGNVVIHGHGDSSCDMGIIMAIQKLYGINGVMDFAKNIKALQHFSQVAKNMGKGMPEAAPISVMPESIMALIQDKKNCEFIWPSDGSPVFPLFMTIKKAREHQMKKVIEFLVGEDLGQFLASSYFASPNTNVINKDYSNKTVNWIGWDMINKNDFKAFSKALENQVLDIIKNQMSEEMRNQVRGRQAVC